MSENNVIIIEVDRKPRKCINCKGNVVPILYGEPSPIGMELIDSGKRIMGGCCVTNNDPQWGCVDCDAMYIKIKR